MVHSDDPEPRRPTDRNLANIVDRDRRRFVGREHDVADVIERMDQTHSAYIKSLLPDVKVAAARVGVRVLNGSDDLRKRNRVMSELRRIEIDMILLGQSAKT